MEPQLDNFEVPAVAGLRVRCVVSTLSPTKAVKVRRVCQTSVELGNAWQCCSPKLPSGTSTGIWPLALSEHNSGSTLQVS